MVPVGHSSGMLSSYNTWLSTARLPQRSFPLHTLPCLRFGSHTELHKPNGTFGEAIDEQVWASSKISKIARLSCPTPESLLLRGPFPRCDGEKTCLPRTVRSGLLSYDTSRARIIENLARALEFSLLVRFVVFLFFIFILLNRGLKGNLFAMLSLSNPKGEVLGVPASFSVIPVLTVGLRLYSSNGGGSNEWKDIFLLYLKQDGPRTYPLILFALFIFSLCPLTDRRL